MEPCEVFNEANLRMRLITWFTCGYKLINTIVGEKTTKLKNYGTLKYP